MNYPVGKRFVLPCFLMVALRLPSRQDLQTVNPESQRWVLENHRPVNNCGLIYQKPVYRLPRKCLRGKERGTEHEVPRDHGDWSFRPPLTNPQKAIPPSPVWPPRHLNCTLSFQFAKPAALVCLSGAGFEVRAASRTRAWLMGKQLGWWAGRWPPVVGIIAAFLDWERSGASLPVSDLHGNGIFMGMSEMPLVGTQLNTPLSLATGQSGVLWTSCPPGRIQGWVFLLASRMPGHC